MTSAPLPTPAHIAPLANLAVVSARGADAVTFLHSQLTQDVQTLSFDAARLAGYCSAKGRLLASMVVWREHGEGDEPPGHEPHLHMLVRDDLAEALVKRLSMFVLRAKVKLAVATTTVYGVTTTQPEPGISGAPWQCLRRYPGTRAGVWISAPGSSAACVRGWWVGEPPAEIGDTADAVRWDAADIAAGLPWVEAATQELFIPQTLNLDLIDAVSFTKGCYPGQEVVARSHYRGTVKRRMAAGTVTPANAAVVAGVDVYQTDAPDAPCGRVVNAAHADGATQLLFEAPLDAMAAGCLRVGGASGPLIEYLTPLTGARRETESDRL